MTQTGTMVEHAYALGQELAFREADIEKSAAVWPALKGGFNLARLLTYGGGPMAQKIREATTNPVAQRFIRDAIFAGALGGTFGVVFPGDPSIPWYQRYLQGAATGALAGLGFRGGIEAARKGVSLIGRIPKVQKRTPWLAERLTEFGRVQPETATIGGIFRHAKQPGVTFGETAKRLGLYAAGGIPLVVGGWYGGEFGAKAGERLLRGAGAPKTYSFGIAPGYLPDAYYSYGLSPQRNYYY